METWTPAVVKGFRRSLLQWYRQQGRDLPWRRSRDPYHIWISEIMLQQTTVVAVIPYFERFLQRFPTLAALAEAPEADVLRLWEGLGYYSRARNLHRAAQVIATDLAGGCPQTVEGWQALPGIGRYTAGAIVSFALDRPAPILEANTQRLYCRLLGFEGDPRSSAGQKLLWSFAEHLVPEQSPGEFNQALMELGSQVCTPQAPACSACPAVQVCAAFREGKTDEIPQAQRRPEITPVLEFSAQVQSAGRLLVYHRQPGERWVGLWDFPRFEWTGELPPGDTELPRWLEQQLHQRFGIQTQVGPEWHALQHSVTRYRITLKCHAADYLAGEPDPNGPPCRWVTPEELSTLPLSMTGRKLAQQWSQPDSGRQRRLF